jgi:hypothetical protein
MNKPTEAPAIRSVVAAIVSQKAAERETVPEEIRGFPRRAARSVAGEPPNNGYAAGRSIGASFWRVSESKILA